MNETPFDEKNSSFKRSDIITYRDLILSNKLSHVQISFRNCDVEKKNIVELIRSVKSVERHYNNKFIFHIYINKQYENWYIRRLNTYQVDINRIIFIDIY